MSVLLLPALRASPFAHNRVLLSAAAVAAVDVPRVAGMEWRRAAMRAADWGCALLPFNTSSSSSESVSSPEGTCASSRPRPVEAAVGLGGRFDEDGRNVL